MHAFSAHDPNDEVNIPYHGHITRGWRSFLLLQPAIPQETDVEYWDVMTTNFSVSPEWDTMYWCKMFRSPPISQKHHITTVDYLILGGNQGDYVHHAAVFECPGADPAEFEPHVDNDGYECYSQDIPNVFNQCDGPFAVWAKGGGPLVLPDHIGFPLDPNPTKYYLLQIHYDNANKDTGKYDWRRLQKFFTSVPLYFQFYVCGGAGFRFHHTSRLRQHDAGLLTIGRDEFAGPNVMIPPGIKDFVVPGHGNPDCYGPVVPPEGVRMTSGMFHTHLIGSRVKQRHFRNNIELPPLVYDKHYDHEFQEYHQFSKEVLLLPRDQLTFECTYDTTNKSRTTFSGLSTREEMCNAFIVYYPRFEGVYGSKSRAPKRTVTHFVNSPKLDRISAGNPDYNQAYADFMADYDWNQTAVRWYENGVRHSDQETICFIGNGDPDTVPTTINYPENLVEYSEVPPCVHHK